MGRLEPVSTGGHRRPARAGDRLYGVQPGIQPGGAAAAFTVLCDRGVRQYLVRRPETTQHPLAGGNQLQHVSATRFRALGTGAAASADIAP